MIFEAMARARARGITTAFAVRGFGYYDAALLQGRRSRLHVQPVPDRRLSRAGRTRQHAARAADRLVRRRRAAESRAFVTFVNPSLHKGLLLFARLADMLGSRRPDIPDPRRAVRPQRRLAERDSGHRFQPIPADHGGAAGSRAGRLLRADADPARARRCGKSRSAASRPRR